MIIPFLLASAIVTDVNPHATCALRERGQTITLRAMDVRRKLLDHDVITCKKKAPPRVAVRFEVGRNAHAVFTDGTQVVVHDTAPLQNVDRTGVASMGAAYRSPSVGLLPGDMMTASQDSSRAQTASTFSPEARAGWARTAFVDPHYQCVLERHGVPIPLATSPLQKVLEKNDIIACEDARTSHVTAAGVVFDGSFFRIVPDGGYYVVNPSGGPTLKKLMAAELRRYLNSNSFALSHVTPRFSFDKPNSVRVNEIMQLLDTATLKPH
jgi:hypothetical protein